MSERTGELITLSIKPFRRVTPPPPPPFPRRSYIKVLYLTLSLGQYRNTVQGTGFVFCTLYSEALNKYNATHRNHQLEPVQDVQRVHSISHYVFRVLGLIFLCSSELVLRTSTFTVTPVRYLCKDNIYYY